MLCILNLLLSLKKKKVFLLRDLTVPLIRGG